MNIGCVNNISNAQAEVRICALIKKAKDSGDDLKTTAELLAEIQNIGLKEVSRYLDYIC